MNEIVADDTNCWPGTIGTGSLVGCITYPPYSSSGHCEDCNKLWERIVAMTKEIEQLKAKVGNKSK